MKDLIYPGVKEGLYKITENGEIWSNYINNFLHPSTDKDGYLKIKLSGGSREKIIYARIATLVAWNYISPPPQSLADPTINHIDGNKLNNHYNNLEWIERSVNTSIRRNTGTGSKNSQSRLKEEQVIDIAKLLINTNLTTQEIAKKFNVSKSTICNILKKKNWSKITEPFDFSCRKLIRNDKGEYEIINTSLLEKGGLK